jgi:hypothetical protein
MKGYGKLKDVFEDGDIGASEVKRSCTMDMNEALSGLPRL